MATIKELIDRHQGEWLAIEITEESEGVPVKGELVYHSPERWKVWEKTQAYRRLYITYAGPPLPRGYAAAFSTLRFDGFSMPLPITELS